ncbi:MULTISPECIES: RsmF rRNA methyltransferase first C-terminal domain-containing protein [unclassified Clostridioides]|uniref:RsmF rRNA methyltransferase first C-terminal domain-containing protein n=2 Tax=unclassified Clostridioides TaxID=2635829 RepID=UPI0007BC3A74|nr:RsmF rRNA methyltransferase first C-terminal domain-containing protein [Clostridioides sp. ZZV14-6387]MDI0266472.1 RsmF rRNA methyltransferase first C-terminal domain-containing protein [Clostridioides difficile]MDI7816423.1 RsmF rRNA methyltransferase first C-terminal domain-containing protein [Clostridioides difficile]CZR95787.1 Ribosomal RNA small subunit methyltransferase F [Clostridioides difficile]CZS06347.1 Ribosomal RNA small subunit methyltransferase F [Clostridioides difficile]
MANLPEEFLEDIREILQDEYDDFIKSYDEDKTTGLRINTLKIDKKKLLDLNLFDLSQIPWAEEGFYYDDKINRPGRNPLHEAGAYYLQEPSAMSVIPKADIKEGDKVLDMCAAPGGKSTYILSKLNDTGLLVSNEINASRIKALGENLERFGVKNCIITNTDSKSLRKTFNGYFDKVVIDAPCSGQGMFRKDEVAISDWSYAKVLECQSIQKEIIRDGYKMLKKDGILIYSTCTFSREENEHVINEFISEYPYAELIEMERLWPHKIKGEGHFVAKIKKLEDEECNVKELKIKNLDKEIKDYREFEKKFLKVDFYSNKKNKFYLRGENLYLLPEVYPDTKKLKVLRYGLHLGVLKKNRFEPSHALSHYLKVEDVKNVENFSVQSDSILKYLKGDVVNSNESRGWVLVSVEGIPLGWGKESAGVIKNHYPKGLRKLF